MYTRRNGSGRYPRRCRDAIAWSFDRDVDQRTRSTPEVRLPLFSVTRFTARALPLNEQVSSRCKALTLPHRLACDALTIRTCSRSTCRSHCSQLIWSQFVTPAEDAHTGCPAFICVFLIRRLCLFSRQSRPAGSPPVFGREVGLLPIRPITGRLWPFPASSARSPIGDSYEALSPSCGENHGITMFRFNDRIDLAPAFTPAVIMSVCFLPGLRSNRLRAFWLQPVSVFGWFALTMCTAVHLRWACHPA